MDKKILYKYIGHASTILIDKIHKLRSNKDHNHSAETSRAPVSIENST